MSYNDHKRFRGDSGENMYNNSYNNNSSGGNNFDGPGNRGDLYHKNVHVRPNNILIFTILNQKYVITIEAIHKISVRFGQVHRIVMIRKKGTQAMVEFDTIDTATRAMDGLQNQDIYSGCCTLKIEYCKATKLNVRRNDCNSWDFTVQPQLTVEATRQPLISGPAPYEGGSSYSGPSSSNYDSYSGGGGGGGRGGGPPPDRDRDGHAGPNDRGSGRTPVAIVYGLTDRINCQHLFNLFCLYGNIIKVKFMKSKPGCAMIEFGDTDSVTRATRMTGVELFGDKITVRPSKSMFIGEPKGESFTLHDKSIGYEDFSQSKFNRFSTAAKAAKNRPQDPRPTVHFYNAPPDINEDKIHDMLEEDNEDLVVNKVVMFPKKDQSKSSAGLIEFAHLGNAVTTIAIFNHFNMESVESSYPFNVKLCFATQDLNQ